MPKKPAFFIVKTVLVIVHSLAFLSTVFRLGHRIRSRRFWWDDFWALIALLSDILLWVIFMALPMPTIRQRSTSLQILSWLGTIISYSTGLWAARISVGVTIVRLLCKGSFRKLAKWVCLVFGVIWLTRVLQKAFSCGTQWSQIRSQCGVPMSTGYLELCTDLVGDAWLVLAPAYMLWHMKITRRHRYLITTIFGCGLFTTCASVAHIAFILLKEPRWVGISGHIQVGISVLVCNLLVLITYIYRVFATNTEDDEASTTTDIISNREQPDGTRASQIFGTIGLCPSSYGTMVSLTDLGSDFGNTPHTSAGLPQTSNDLQQSTDTTAQTKDDSQARNSVSYITQNETRESSSNSRPQVSNISRTMSSLDSSEIPELEKSGSNIGSAS
ncbi:hypothetical protein B0H34DRAFT_800049 [Crassisporium funariophilum]|nr:hypothetical protein B0H34DRAFT_800049 [Crassisporium funariophilum]